VGDLVLYNPGSEYSRFGIIVGIDLPTDPVDPNKKLEPAKIGDSFRVYGEEIYVLTTNAASGQVVVGPLLGNANILSTANDNQYNFQFRSWLRMGNENWTTQDWDFLAPNIAGARVKIYNHRAGEEDEERNLRYIPNTGEFHNFKLQLIRDRIEEVEGVPRLIEDTVIPGEEWVFDFDIISDYSYEQDPEGGHRGNLFRNEGAGWDVFVKNPFYNSNRPITDNIVTEAGTIKNHQYIFITRFEIDEDRSGAKRYSKIDSLIIESDSPDQPNQSLPFYGLTPTEIGQLNGWRMVFEDYGKIEFLDANGTVLGEESSFAIRPISGHQQWYPGDNLQINLKARGKNDPPEGAAVSVPGSERYFLANYDKKMLWRANLYLDETDNDWNTLNPWNVPIDANNEGAWRE